ncbi:MAG: YkgJ family cysteine cluster protein [Methanospirillum sp.]
MTDVDTLAREIAKVGFACVACGDCCRGVGEDGSLVMVARDEARRVAAAANLSFAEAVVPFPGEVEVRGRTCRLGWALARDENGACRFHTGERCSVYEARPWICRTYPFMLDDDELVVSECPGLGTPISKDDARALAADLLARRAAEEDEGERVRRVVISAELPPDGTVVIDAEGVTRA